MTTPETTNSPNPNSEVGRARSDHEGLTKSLHDIQRRHSEEEARAESLEVALEDLHVNHTAELEELRAAHDADLDELQAIHDAASEDLNTTHVSELEEINADHAIQLEALDATHAAELEASRRQIRAQADLRLHRAAVIALQAALVRQWGSELVGRLQGWHDKSRHCLLAAALAKTIEFEAEMKVDLTLTM